MSQLGDNLRFCREKLSYTQEEIAQYLGMSQPAYNKHEKGMASLSVQQLERIAALYGVEEYDLLHASGEELKIPLTFAFRKEGPVGKLEDIAAFKKIVNNYLFLCDELGKD